ncbi:hypothetical protein F5Y10DRAFT_146998 [Nemania abortiva]|nr:hypothetical protein F5Y10DRAFT_146998 [Nemania abortiva]
MEVEFRSAPRIELIRRIWDPADLPADPPAGQPGGEAGRTLDRIKREFESVIEAAQEDLQQFEFEWEFQHGDGAPTPSLEILYSVCDAVKNNFISTHEVLLGALNGQVGQLQGEEVEQMISLATQIRLHLGFTINPGDDTLGEVTVGNARPGEHFYYRDMVQSIEKSMLANLESASVIMFLQRRRSLRGRERELEDEKRQREDQLRQLQDPAHENAELWWPEDLRRIREDERRNAEDQEEEETDISSDRTFSDIFTFKHIRILSSIKIRPTNNLLHHLFVQRTEFTVTVYVFSHASLLETLRSTPGFPDFYKELCKETLDTLRLLVDPEDTSFKKHPHKRLFDQTCQQSILNRRRVSRVAHYKFWRKRLLDLEDAYEKSYPRTLSGWWHNRRNRGNWVTFWIAFAGAIFGLLALLLALAALAYSIFIGQASLHQAILANAYASNASISAVVSSSSDTPTMTGAGQTEASYLVTNCYNAACYFYTTIGGDTSMSSTPVSTLQPVLMPSPTAKAVVVSSTMVEAVIRDQTR